MAIRKLILGRNNEETSLIFDKQVNIIDDLALSKELGTENIKNEDSTLILKSLSDTQIADVIQIKINLTAVGCLLVNFSKDSLTEENRKSLLDQLSALKDKVQETQETQEVKFRKILCIIEQFNPIYVTFLNDLEFKIDSNKIAKEVEWSFPLIVLAVAPKQPSFFEKVKSFKLFSGKYFQWEYLYTTAFGLLAAFAFITGLGLVFTKASVAVYLFILTAIFCGILCYILNDILPKQNDKNLKFVFLIYIFIGWLLGAIGGYFISKYVISKEMEIDNLVFILAGTLPSLALTEAMIWLTIPVNWIVNKIKSNKK